jgi:class 3 adenylate cyclase
MNNESADNAPIADRYPDCTVFFADIVGFTAWSSTRDPVEVFVLLEALVSPATKT